MTSIHAFLPPVTPKKTYWDRVTIKVADRAIDLAVETDGEAVLAVSFGAQLPQPRDDRKRLQDPNAVAGARQELEAYAAGDLEDFDLLLRPSGTPFQLQVWSALTGIPFGRTTSYGAIASEVGKPRAARAIGGAVGSNPTAVVIPCHRVIGTDGSLTGFGGGLDTKVSLLVLEGVISG
jgi:methylated-DNA-[protein]-cysteine S-methyltransferase